MNDVNKLAEEYATLTRGKDYSDVSNNVNFELMKKSFIAGWNKRKEVGAEGFEHFWETVSEAYSLHKYNDIYEAVKDAWVESRIAADKQIKELQKNLDRECDETFLQEGKIKELQEENKELEDKLQKIIQEDFINEDAYGWTQYCQSMIYGYDKEIAELKSDLEYSTRSCIDSRPIDGYAIKRLQEIRTKWGL
jgi:DNA repair exonuclease SbcCD ATPase subunit